MIGLHEDPSENRMWCFTTESDIPQNLCRAPLPGEEEDDPAEPFPDGLTGTLAFIERLKRMNKAKTFYGWFDYLFSYDDRETSDNVSEHINPPYGVTITRGTLMGSCKHVYFMTLYY